MALQFIDQSSTGIGAPERRLIRSHVMRGKNAGRPRRSTKKSTNIDRIPRLLHLPCNVSPWSRYSMPRQLLWNDLCLTSFPQELDPESTRLMHRWFFDISDALFPPQFCSKFDIVKSIWVNSVLADEAYFHSTLAISASYVDFYERKPGISSKTLHHITKAYALVNVKLSSPESVSDNAIAAVVSLAIYQQIHHQHSTGLIHLNGLYRMIRLRGGMAKLMRENRALALKPLRLDVEFAMIHGSPTLFRSDAVPISAVLCNFNVKGKRLPITTLSLPPLMLDVFIFAKLLNDKEQQGGSKLDPLDYTETLISLLYRLIEVAPLRRPLPLIRGLQGDVVHLAMLAFMTTLLPEYVRDQSSCPLLSARLGSAIQDLYITSGATQDSDLSLSLWALFISGISVLKLMDHRWLLFLVLDTCERLSLDNWAAVHRQLGVFPWIHTLHDVPGRCIWEETQRIKEQIL